MALRAVLFDVGGPLNTEVVHERLMDERIRAALAADGFAVDDASYERACRWAVDSFASDTYAAIVWRLAGQDAAAARRVYARMRSSRGEYVFELREGVPALLRELRDRGLLLGLAANQPRATVARLDALRIGHFFAHREVSGVHGFAKPDVRLFLRCCEDLGVSPEECVVVGDRVDNDVVPARAAGLIAVHLRRGPWGVLQARWPEAAQAHLALDGLAGLPDALDAIGRR